MDMQDQLIKAEAGDVEAMMEVADAYFIGNGLPEDDEAAEMWYQKAFAAAPDHPAVLCEKASRCLQEVGLLKMIAPEQAEAKRQEALAMYERAVDCGSESACYKVGNLFLRGDMLADVPADVQKAVEYLTQGVEMGSVSCINLLAECYENGDGVPQDVPKAIEMRERAAAQGNPVALRNLAIRYSQGDGVPKNCHKALDYNLRAAERGEDYAALHAAQMLLQGEGVPVDETRGMACLRRAVEMGNEEAAALLERITAKAAAPTPPVPAPAPVSAPVQKKGCYIATAVYGSYDCPEVWTLRRFRDNCLEKGVCGRLLVRVYYRISPWLVEHLGRFNSVRTVCRRMLDGLVCRLNGRGFDNTPYND